ncbi:hypothetical protein AA313_de0210042 [Arthrobotrys entomopaga]|nr:hypothetical protein AA313_de0210042 [Arthrobotrys entomopaga]
MRESSLLYGICSLVGLASAAAKPGWKRDHVEGCNANNCLRDYTTISEVAHQTLLVTYTDTEFQTLTVIDRQTATTILPGTTVSITMYTPVVQKRQATSAIPPYATPCTGTAEYTSACSCIGITGPIVVTAPAPSTTLTLPTTTTYSTETIITTVETESITVTDATTTLATTDSTATFTGPSATVSVILSSDELCENPPLHATFVSDEDILGTFIAEISAKECCRKCWASVDCMFYYAV